MENNNSSKKSIFISIGIILVISILLECSIFNYRSIESVFNQKIENINVSFNNGSVTDGKSPCSVKHSENVVLTISDINETVKNIKLDVTVDGMLYVPITISATDEGNSSYKSFPEREIISGIKASKYIRLNLAGKAKNIKVELKETGNKNVIINAIGLNEKVPYTFSLLRILFVFIILTLFWLIRPSSFVYGLNPDIKQRKKAFYVLLLVNILLILVLVNINPVFKNPLWEHHKQYHKLAESLAKGQFYLDAIADEKLVAMENPYDYTTRVQTVGLSNFLWDHAYFEGKYYVYFGIVPCILYYLPIYLLTGIHMPTYIVIFINASLSVLGIMLLLKEIIKRKYPDLPCAIYLILCQMLIIGGGLWLISKRPDFYFVPISTAIMLTLFGLYFWIKSIDSDKLNKRYLIFGSLFMALVAGARPQFILASFFIFMIFYESFKDKKILSKTSSKETLSVCIPYFIVAAFLMFYNFKRFGSPFDFGANYNLTFNDMTLRGIKADRSFLGWFSYLLQPPVITANFPFLHPSTLYTAYQGTTITEEMFGGFFITNPFSWFCVLSPFIRKYFSDKKQFIITIMCSIFTLIIVFADTQMAGILSRYLADFGLFLYFGSTIAFMTLYCNVKSDEGKKLIRSVLVICLAFALFYNLLLIFTGTGESIKQCNPDLYYKVRFLTTFWN